MTPEDMTVAARPAPGGRASSAPLIGKDREPTLFEMSVPGRTAYQLRTTGIPVRPLTELLPAEVLADEPTKIAEVSERDLVAHFTRLSHRQFSGPIRWARAP